MKARLTRTVHINQSVRVAAESWVITANDYGLSSVLLRLPHFMRKLAFSTLNKGNPRLRFFRYMGPTDTELWAAYVLDSTDCQT